MPSLEDANDSTEVDNVAEEQDDELSGNENATDPKSQQTTVQEQRKAQKFKFRSWMQQVAERADADEQIEEIESKGASANFLSVSHIVAQHESEAIINDPREYQLELYERAKAENTIAVLDTGSGKTLIAVLLLRHILDRELEDRAAGLTHRVAFFIVRKREKTAHVLN